MHTLVRSLFRTFTLSLLVIAVAISSSATAAEFPGKQSTWNGFRRYDFTVDGKSVLVVAPNKPAPGRPWVWHGEFFGHRPAPDVELLKRGFHIAYLSVPNMLGCPDAVRHWDACYEELTTKHGLAAKVALVGLSRGGLYCYNWAAANPDKVACIYGDAPVCDFKSWPGGKGTGKGSARDWQLVLERYGFANDAEALAYNKNPIDSLAPLAAAKVPLLHVFGDADDVVPWEENTGILATRYRQLGGSILLIQKPGIGHHPHGLDDPAPIVEFIEQHASLEMPARYKPRLRDPIDRMAAEIESQRLVVYKKAGGRELYQHFLFPEGWKPSDKRSCFLIIHGGGWTGGEPTRMYPFPKWYVDQGMVGISIQYRLLNKERGTTVFDCVKDGRSAVRFVKAHAGEFGIDPEKIIVSGGSAGGHVALATAVLDGEKIEGIDEAGEATDVSPVPAALMLLFPVIDTSKDGYGAAKIGERWKDLSPVHQVSGKVPPTIIFHGSTDTVTPLAGAVAFRDSMHKLDNRCELDIYEGGQHGYLMQDRDIYLDAMTKTDAFLKSLGLLDDDLLKKE